MPTTVPIASVDEALARLSLDEKVGQLLVAVPTPAMPEARFVDAGAGGVLLPNETGGAPREIADRVAAAQERAIARTGLPLLVAADQEGGDMSFARDLVTEVPSNMALGATGDPRAARDAAALLAGELGALGINWDLAPVLDVNTDPTNPVIGVRAYGDDPALVAAFGAEAIGAFQAHGVLACAKHFPGHGATGIDSHLDLPVLRHARDRLEGVELVPFRAAIAAGVASVMSAHLLVPALDRMRPSTLSSRTLTTLLRGELGFDGLVVTDAMHMGAIAGTHDDGEAAVRAIVAGADVVLGGKGVARHRRVHRAVAHGLRSGAIRRRRFEAALARVVRAKLALGRHAPDGHVGSDAARAAALALARRSITIVRDGAGLLPLPRELGPRLVVLSPSRARATKMEEWHSRPTALGAEIAARIPGAVDVPIGYPLTAAERRAVARVTRSAAVVVVGTLNAALDPSQITLLQWLAEATSARIVVAALRGPYDAVRLPWVRTVVCSYSSARPSLVACAEVLTGETVASGRLPVTLPSPAPDQIRRTSA